MIFFHINGYVFMLQSERMKNLVPAPEVNRRMKYNTLSDALKKQFGTKVYKLSLQTGCSCPNRDGTIGSGGCSFCSEGGSGDFASGNRLQKPKAGLMQNFL